MARSENFVIEHDFEHVFVVNRETGHQYDLGSHYGDPVTAVISPDESWFAAGGEGVTWLHRGRGYHEFLRGTDVSAIHEIRVSYQNPASGVENILHAVRREPSQSVSVRLLRVTPSGDLEIFGDEPDEQWILNTVTLSISKMSGTEPMP